jgi:hypothetical protein
MADWEPYAAAAFAPVAVWVLWRFQVLSVEALRHQMVKMTRHFDQKWIYHIVSWFGTLLHEISHASVLLLSGHGIRDFSVRSEQGHVTPQRMRKGPVSFLFFLVAALAPLFIPPALVLVGLLWLNDWTLVPWTVAESGLEEAWNVVRDLGVEFPKRLGLAIANLDLAKPWHLAVFLVILLGTPGSRPSHVKGSRFHGTNDEGDVAVLRSRVRQNPIPFLLFIGLLYGAYFVLGRWAPEAYWHGFEAVWAVALTGIVLALFGFLWWSLAVLDARTLPVLAWIGFAMFVTVQIVGRALPVLDADPWRLNAASVAAWFAVSLLLGLVLPRPRMLR